ncbi:MAG: LecA/PA-IL family lectin [Blastocatellia bacterium]|nr:LecA/PA-IL family lectin [Blastocatellia bacterium]MCS7157591.1 LecA/PA-IL family lectin [Blastocatellia bacterium]MCX7751856.1 LecA/PA-IL family lectin [Blastocatellia bacterium]MDW8166962.1 hypothetical protein [Acidobacteriota bacterium]MDW8257066.1 hypothetical protein [Acidobacteriota bacterium]
MRCTLLVLVLIAIAVVGISAAESSPVRSTARLSVQDRPVAQEPHTVWLRNGSVLRGRVVRFENGEFTLILSGTQSRAILKASDVERIDFGGAETPVEAPRAQEGAPSARPAQELATSAPTPAGAVALPRYTERTVKVPANQEWIDTGIDVVEGQKLRLAVSGRIRVSATQEVGPEGIEREDPDRLMPHHPSGAVIAVIGDDNDEFLFIGPAAEIVAHRRGRLFLTVNEGTLRDNSGEFLVRIQVGEPPRVGAKRQ